MSERVVVKFKGPHVPRYQTPGSSGFDLVSNQDVTIAPFDRIMVRTGLYLEIPPGYEGQLRARSGLALKHGIFILNGIGTIDSDYRGEIGVILGNMNVDPYPVKVGQRIAQMVIAPVIQAFFEETEEMSTTVRGSGGFGSTGYTG